MRKSTIFPYSSPNHPKNSLTIHKNLPHIPNFIIPPSLPPNTSYSIKPQLNKSNATVSNNQTPNTSFRFIDYHNRNLNHIKKITLHNDEIKRNVDQKKKCSVERLNLVKKHFKVITSEEKEEIKEKKRRESYNLNKKRQKYYYTILPGNNRECIRQCMKTRRNWRETPVSLINHANLIWTPTSNQIPFINLYHHNPVRPMGNHYECHSQISNKQNLLVNMARYCEKKKLDLWKYLPMTILLHYDTIYYDKQYEAMKILYWNVKQYLAKDSNDVNSYRKYREMFYFDCYEKIGMKTSLYIPHSHYNGRNIWLVKAPNLNRGRCIKIIDSIDSLESKIKSFHLGIKKQFEHDDTMTDKHPLPKIINHPTSLSASFAPNSISNSNSNNHQEQEEKYKANVVVIQKYIEKPLLYNGRKFDMRLWVLVTHTMDVYAFKEGHLKASSMPYDINSKNAYVHLTNYSVQKHNVNFAQYEDGNEISFKDFQFSLKNEHKKDVSVNNDIFPQLCEIIKISMKSVKKKLNPFHRKYCFELFGYDFIFDENAKPYLLEVNTNPGLEESSELIKMLVPRMIDDTLRLTIDDCFFSEYIYGSSHDYQSAFDVRGYTNRENLWEFVCSLDKKKTPKGK